MKTVRDSSPRTARTLVNRISTDQGVIRAIATKVLVNISIAWKPIGGFRRLTLIILWKIVRGKCPLAIVEKGIAAMEDLGDDFPPLSSDQGRASFSRRSRMTFSLYRWHNLEKVNSPVYQRLPCLLTQCPWVSNDDVRGPGVVTYMPLPNHNTLSIYTMIFIYHDLTSSLKTSDMIILMYIYYANIYRLQCANKVTVSTMLFPCIK